MPGEILAAFAAANDHVPAMFTSHGKSLFKPIARHQRIQCKWSELQKAGWQVGKDRVERIWRREGLKVPKRQKPRGRLWRNDGSCMRLRPERPNHVWSYDFVSAFTHDGRMVRMPNLIDEYTRKCLAVRPRRRINSRHVIEVLADAMIEHSMPEYIRSDNVLTREGLAEGKKRFLSIPYGMETTVTPGGFHMQGRSDRP